MANSNRQKPNNANVTELGISMLIDMDDMAKCLRDMDPSDRMKAYLKLMEFVVPKKQSIAQDINAGIKDSAERLVESMLKDGN